MQKSRKKLSPEGLLGEIKAYFVQTFSKVKTKRQATDPSLVDCLMACFAVFHLKFPSLLQYDKQRQDDSPLLKNLKTLYQIENPPCDTTMRERLDVIEPSSVRGTFKKIFACAQRGKVLESYEYLEGHYLVSIDATSQFSSQNVSCENCCEKHHSNGKVSYYHHALAGVIVHPHIKRVIPFAPEPITKQDGASKNDCEQSAAKRLLRDLRREHPHLKVVINEDSLYATGPHVALLKELDMRFIIGAKPGILGYLFDWVRLANPQAYSHDGNGYRHEYQFINGVPINDTNFDTKVNFLEYWETGPKGKKQHFSWITDIPLTQENVEWIMRGGRARWRIENETFNTLKNQGYQFEHNFGHGQKYLCTIMGMLMMLAFLIDQVSELCDDAFQRAKRAAGPYYALWEDIRAALRFCVCSDWDILLEAVVRSHKKGTG